MENQKTHTTSRDIKARTTKERVFKAAIHLFRQYGYDSVTIDDIAKEAKVSKGTFYLYFDTKEAVLVKQFGLMDAFYRRSAREIPTDQPVDRQLLSFLMGMCEYCARTCGVNIIKILYSHQISIGTHPELLNNKKRSIYKILHYYVREGRARGAFKTSLSDEQITEVISRAIHGFFYDWCLYDGSFDIIKESGPYFSGILSLIQAENEAAL